MSAKRGKKKSFRKGSFILFKPTPQMGFSSDIGVAKILRSHRYGFYDVELFGQGDSTYGLSVPKDSVICSLRKVVAKKVNAEVHSITNRYCSAVDLLKEHKNMKVQGIIDACLGKLVLRGK